MEVLLSFLIGALYATGFYLMMRRNIIKLIIGVALLSHAANLLIFTVGGLVRGRPPIVEPGQSQLLAPYPDPVPQALILTAIVIGFAVQAFAAVLIRRTHEESGTDDLDALETTERVS